MMPAHAGTRSALRNLPHEQQSALDIFALLDRLGIEQFCGIGFSSGAMILLQMATAQPARVKAMVVIDGTYPYTQESRAVQSGLTAETIDPSLLALLRTWHARGEEQVRSLIDHFRGFSEDDLNLTPSALAAVTAQTLIVHGDRDEFFPVSISLGMYQAIPRAYLWVVPSAQHSLFFKVFGGTAPGGDIFSSTALAFLRGDWESKGQAQPQGKPIIWPLVTTW